MMDCLGVTYEEAVPLLHHYKWDASLLQEAWFSDPIACRRSAGVTAGRSPPLRGTAHMDAGTGTCARSAAATIDPTAAHCPSCSTCAAVESASSTSVVGSLPHAVIQPRSLAHTSSAAATLLGARWDSAALAQQMEARSGLIASAFSATEGPIACESVTNAARPCSTAAREGCSSATPPLHCNDVVVVQESPLSVEMVDLTGNVEPRRLSALESTVSLPSLVAREVTSPSSGHASSTSASTMCGTVSNSAPNVVHSLGAVDLPATFFDPVLLDTVSYSDGDALPCGHWFSVVTWTD